MNAEGAPAWMRTKVGTDGFERRLLIGANGQSEAALMGCDEPE